MGGYGSLQTRSIDESFFSHAASFLVALSFSGIFSWKSGSGVTCLLARFLENWIGQLVLILWKHGYNPDKRLNYGLGVESKTISTLPIISQWKISKTLVLRWPIVTSRQAQWYYWENNWAFLAAPLLTLSWKNVYLSFGFLSAFFSKIENLSWSQGRYDFKGNGVLIFMKVEATSTIG